MLFFKIEIGWIPDLWNRQDRDFVESPAIRSVPVRTKCPKAVGGDSIVSSMIGSLLIVLFGIVVLMSTQPVLKIASRHHSLGEQVGGSTLLWLTRSLGIILCILGLVTMVQR
jgi:hypothetical protein